MSEQEEMTGDDGTRVTISIARCDLGFVEKLFRSYFVKYEEIPHEYCRRAQSDGETRAEAAHGN